MSETIYSPFAATGALGTFVPSEEDFIVNTQLLGMPSQPTTQAPAAPRVDSQFRTYTPPPAGYFDPYTAGITGNIPSFFSYREPPPPALTPAPAAPVIPSESGGGGGDSGGPGAATVGGGTGYGPIGSTTEGAISGLGPNPGTMDRGFGQATYGPMGSTLGTLAGMATGVPGLGLGLGALGTLADVRGLNTELGMMGLPQEVSFPSSFLSNMTAGYFGTPAATQFGSIMGFDALAEAPLSAFAAPVGGQASQAAPAGMTEAEAMAAGMQSPGFGTGSYGFGTDPSKGGSGDFGAMSATERGETVGPGSDKGVSGGIGEPSADKGAPGIGGEKGDADAAAAQADAAAAAAQADAAAAAANADADASPGGVDSGGGGGGDGPGGGDSDGGGGNCFVAGTLVHMADGTQRPIETVEVGDEIISWAENGPARPGTVKALIRGMSDDLIEIKYGDTTIRCTPNHRFHTPHGWFEAGDLEADFKVFDVDGNEVTLDSVRGLDGSVPVYNLTIGPFPHYIAGGLRVHNEKHEGGLIGVGEYPRTGANVGELAEVMVPALEGEYVVRPEAVAKYGLDFLESLNSGTLDVKEFEAQKAEPEEFAGGGLVPLAGGGKIAIGPGGGLDDLIPTSINGRRAAALSDGEFVIPADVVSMMGDGSSNAGARRLYDLVRQVRDEKTGTTKQAGPLPVGEILKRSMGR